MSVTRAPYPARYGGLFSRTLSLLNPPPPKGLPVADPVRSGFNSWVRKNYPFTPRPPYPTIARTVFIDERPKPGIHYLPEMAMEALHLYRAEERLRQLTGRIGMGTNDFVPGSLEFTRQRALDYHVSRLRRPRVLVQTFWGYPRLIHRPARTPAL